MKAQPKMNNQVPGGKVAIYRLHDGKAALEVSLVHESVWLSLRQLAELFGRDKSVISRHLKSIFLQHELEKKAVVALFATTASDGKTYKVDYYNLDAVLSVGYRVNSKKATQFRIWATSVLKSHLIAGYTINRKRIGKNYDAFMRAVESVRVLAPAGAIMDTKSVLFLVSAFADTWFSLDAYDRGAFVPVNTTKKSVALDGTELLAGIGSLKSELLKKGEATELFASERASGSVSGIIGNVLQSFGGKELYPSVEEKAAHLLYFMVKNHPFSDGNKRSGAFAFAWFLQKAGLLDAKRLTPDALTALTLLVAESNPKEKEKMTGLVVLLLQK